MNPVHTAALLGNLQCLKLLNPDKVHFFLPTSNARQDLPVHLASYGGHTDVVKWIVECGVRIDGRNRKGNTTLDIAIEKGNIRVVNKCTAGRSQWPRRPRRRSRAAHQLRLWVRIPQGGWMSVCCECCVLSGRGLCDEPITRLEESYRL